MNEKAILKSPLFLLGLGLLLLNDFYLKSAYGNFATGKLSDVTGLFIFPLFLTAFFPKKVWQCFVFTALFFTFWKLPYSDLLIQEFNHLNIPIGRTVDPTDLFALTVLPLAYIYRKSDYSTFRVHTIPIALVCFIAFCATSRARYLVAYSAPVEYNFDYPKNQLIDELNQLSIRKLNKWDKDSEIQYSADGNFFYAPNTGDTIASFIDYSELDGNDTIDYKTFPSRFIINGKGDKSSIRLLFVSSPEIQSVTGGIALDAVKEFERQVVRKLK